MFESMIGAAIARMAPCVTLRRSGARRMFVDRRIRRAATPRNGFAAERQALPTRRSEPVQLAKPAAGLTPELARRHALDLQEAAVEVGDVVEAHVVADVGDVAVRLHQQQARAADAQAV